MVSKHAHYSPICKMRQPEVELSLLRHWKGHTIIWLGCFQPTPTCNIFCSLLLFSLPRVIHSQNLRPVFSLMVNRFKPLIIDGSKLVLFTDYGQRDPVLWLHLPSTVPNSKVHKSSIKYTVKQLASYLHS